MKNMQPYLSYPDGYEKWCHDVLPFYFRPMKKMLMPLLLQIMRDG